MNRLLKKTIDRQKCLWNKQNFKIYWKTWLQSNVFNSANDEIILQISSYYIKVVSNSCQPTVSSNENYCKTRLQCLSKKKGSHGNGSYDCTQALYGLQTEKFSAPVNSCVKVMQNNSLPILRQSYKCCAFPKQYWIDSKTIITIILWNAMKFSCLSSLQIW